MARFLVFVLIATSGTVLWWWWQAASPERPPGMPRVSTGHAARVRVLEAAVQATGRVRARHAANIQAEVPGRIDALLVHEGSPVDVGTELLRLDDARLRADRDAAEAELSASLAEQESLGKEIARIGVEAERDRALEDLAAAEIEEARALRDRLRSILERNEALTRAGTVSLDELQSADVALRMSEQRMQALLAKRVHAAAQVAVADALVEEARARHRAAGARVRAAEARRDRAVEEHRKCVLTSPMKGTVVALYVQAGERAVPGILSNPEATLMTLANLEDLVVQVALDETDVVDVRPGQQAQLAFEALPGRAFRGVVEDLSGIPRREDETAQGPPRDYLVRISIDEEPIEMRIGFGATVSIATARRENVVVVPFPAIVERAGQRGVFVLGGDRVTFRPIVAGIVGTFSVEVREGLDAGEEIVVGGFEVLRALEHGDRVVRERVDAYVPEVPLADPR